MKQTFRFRFRFTVEVLKYRVNRLIFQSKTVKFISEKKNFHAFYRVSDVLSAAAAAAAGHHRLHARRQ